MSIYYASTQDVVASFQRYGLPSFGTGVGASANISTVDGNGAITSIKYVSSEDSAAIYPIGGIGYRPTDITANLISVYPSSNIVVTSITNGKFILKDIAYQTYDTYANAFFKASVSGIDAGNNALKIYNHTGTLNSTRPIISLANTPLD